MLISSPFLPPHREGETDADWLLRAMAGGEVPGQGMFPLSANGAWHGGLHLVAPGVEGQPGQFEPVRAIADGVVVYRRTPTTPSDDIKHPLNYHSPHNTPQWTHDGVVVIKHESEIGEGDNAKVTYFSTTQHLSALDEHLPALGQRIWRKDKIGTAGSVYGEPNRIHLEVIAAKDQVQRLCGRTETRLSTSGNGRADSIFGDVYVKLPSGTTWISEVLFPDAHHPKRNSAGDPGGTVAYTSTEDLYVGLHYERGDCTITCYREDGHELGSVTEPGQIEYGLYDIATKRYPACPSAGYELLRFARVIGPDALNPADAPHWRQVPYGGGTAWVNLNAIGLLKFSDADTPHWRGWQLVDDDTDGDVRCNSDLIGGILNSHQPGTKLSDSIMVAAALNDTNVKAAIKRLVCKFPTEWAEDDALIDQRYAWLKSLPEWERLEEDDYQEFKTFVKKLGFFGAANISGLDATHWHFSPREFIVHFRRCGWLASLEFAQCFPRKQLHLSGTAFVGVTKKWADALATADRWTTPFNKANRRYGVSATKQRLVHYFSHVIPETAFLSLVKESDDLRGTYLKRKAYWPYYGRGLIQLTWLDNYQKYGRFRSFEIEDRADAYRELGWNPDTLIALNNSSYHASNCADSACFFIIKTAGMLRRVDTGITQADAIAVSKFVNGDVGAHIERLNGLEIRLQSILFLRDVLLDSDATSSEEKISFDWRRNSQAEAIADSNGKPSEKHRFILRESPWLLSVSLAKQRP